MKKILTVVKAMLVSLIIFSIIVGLSGCGKKSQTISADWAKTTDSKYTTSQSYFEQCGILAESDKGYYYKESKGNDYLIYFFDKQSRKGTVLCNQPNCKHRDDTCSAYLKGNVSPDIQYYGGYLYYVVKDDNRNKLLYRMNETGGDKKEIMTLCTADEGYQARIWLNNNYLVYYVMNNTASAFKIYTVNMDTNVKTEIADVSGSNIEDIKFSGDKMAFLVAQSGSGNVPYYLYDFSNNKFEKILDNIDGRGLMLDGNDLYYDDNHVVYKYDLKSRTNVGQLTTYDSGHMDISYDSKYIYTYNVGGNNRNIQVFDKNDNMVDTIICGSGGCFFGGEDYLFMDTKEGMLYFDKSQIGTGNGEWVKIPENN